ncbi:MAG TPA: hypothetical protein VMB72_11710 [Acidimicrobiales bacterium]|nr:hypothetical protein [Acidimicrobiales bacterium]
MRRGRWLAVVTAMITVASATAACGSNGQGPTPSAFAGQSASDILHLALRNAMRADDVVFSIKTSGATQQTVDGATGAAGGYEVVSSPEGQVHIEVIGPTAYIASPAEGLVATMGMTQAVAEANAGRWISVKSSDQPFPQLSQALSFKSLLDEFTPGGTLHLSFTKFGARTVGLVIGSGTAAQAVKSFHVELAVSATTPELPVGAVLQISANGNTVTQTAVFAQWGKPVTLETPPGAVTWDSVVPQ